MKWNKLIEYGELLLSLLVVFLMLVASVVYGGYLFGKKIGEKPTADTVSQTQQAAHSTEPVKPFHGDMTLEKLRAEDSLAALKKDSNVVDATHHAAEVAETHVAEKNTNGQETANLSSENKAQEGATKRTAQSTSIKKTSAVSAGASVPNASQLSEMGLSGAVLTAYDKGLWQAENSSGKVLGTVVASEPFASGVKGFAGPTPVYVYVNSSGVVKAVVAADNSETPEFFSALSDENLFKSWNGKTTTAAASMPVDAVTGATFSSRAVIQNVQAALKHYHSNDDVKEDDANDKPSQKKLTTSSAKPSKLAAITPVATEKQTMSVSVVREMPLEKKAGGETKEGGTNVVVQSESETPNTASSSVRSTSFTAAYGVQPPDADRTHRLGLEDVSLEPADTGVWNVMGRDGAIRGTLLSSAPFTKHIKGYHGPTPLFVLLSDVGKIERVVPIANEETPSFFSQLEEKHLFDSWNGKLVSEAIDVDVDAVTGATFSSRAVIQNVRTVLAHYQHTTADNSTAPIIGWLKTILVLLVMLIGVVARYRFKANKKIRLAVLLLNVVVIGCFCGQFLSLGMLRDWLADGVDIIAVLPAFAMLLLTLVLGFLGKPNHHCTWVCPLGSLQELAYRLPLPKVKLRPRAYKVMRYVRLSVFLLVLLLAWVGVAIDGFLDYEPFSAFLITTAAPVVIVLCAFFIVASIFVPNVWCRCFCVLGEALNLSQRKD